MPCKFPSGHPDENNNFGNAEVCGRYGGVWVDLPGSQASNEQLDFLTNFTGSGVLKRGMGAIQKVVPKFTGTPNTVQQVQKVAQPVAQKTEQLIASRPAPTTGLFNKASEKLAGQVRQHPVIATTAVAAPVVSLMSDGGPVTDKKVVQQQTTASPLVSFKERKARDTALNKAIESGNKDMVDKILSTGRALEVSDTVTKKTKGGSNLFDWSKAGTPAADLIDKDTYKNVKKNESSLWDNMQSKDWWFNPVEGGAGGWDNRLFRLGEMMSYMGTPLSKRGDSPAKRWTTANTEAEKLKAAVAKAGTKKTNLFSKVGNTQLEQSIKHDVFKQMGGDEWFDFDPSDEELQQQVSEAAIAIQTLIDSGYSYADAKQLVLDSIQ